MKTLTQMKQGEERGFKNMGVMWEIVDKRS